MADLPNFGRNYKTSRQYVRAHVQQLPILKEIEKIQKSKSFSLDSMMLGSPPFGRGSLTKIHYQTSTLSTPASSEKNRTWLPQEQKNNDLMLLASRSKQRQQRSFLHLQRTPLLLAPGLLREHAHTVNARAMRSLSAF